MTFRALTISTSVLLAALALAPHTARAQGSFGIGPRLTFIRGTEGSPEGSQRFTGGAIRLGGGRTAIEIAMDYRSGVTGNLTERIKDYPIQASLLLYPVRGRIAPYLLGGIGWYSQRIERFTGTGASATVLEGETTRKMGYHGGLGGEVRVHRHLGLYGDYRYTFIRFGDSPDETLPASGGPTPFPGWIPFAERLKLSHEGSMWTWGATVYF